MAGRGQPTPGDEEAEPIRESVRYLLERQRLRPRRRQLDGEGQAVQVPDDAARRGNGVIVVGQMGSCRPRPAEEQPDGLGRLGLGAVGVRRRDGHRRHRVVDFTGDAKGFAARRQDLHAGAGDQQLLGKIGGRLADMLAVVEDDDEARISHVVRERTGSRRCGAFTQPHGERDSRSDKGPVRDAREVGEPGSVGEVWQ